MSAAERAASARAERLKGWTPVRLYWQQSRPFVDWCYTGDARFREPFFDMTIEKCLRRPFSLLFRHQTPVETLGELYDLRQGLRPAGFVFHMTRCGSTLVSRTLAALPQNVVLSEAGPLDEVLRAHARDPSADEARRAVWLRWMLGALGQKACAEERHLFVKFDAWHALSFDVITRAFPDVPAVFLYREPVEVMVSQLKRTPSWMLTGMIEPLLLGLSTTDAVRMPREEYCARVLAKICAAALRRHQEDGGRLRLVNYHELPEAVWSSISNHFGVEHNAEDVGRMRRAAQLDAKSPATPFAHDTAAKNRDASEEIRRAAERWVQPVYEQLEAARLAQTGDT